jgi:inhibitor of KinA sporulation pathway (predicted exonuclease)/DNA-directed RNA polymerase subunit RPC12/RpoP
MSMATKEWEQNHPTTDGVPSRLFTDENPATTIKGTGFKDREMAERTIFLTSQKGVRYKQYWTIKAMRERAAFHPHQSSGMRDAIIVFDKWLKEEEGTAPLSKQERIQLELEWKEYRKLCDSAANSHSYSNSPSKEDLKRAREDLRSGRDCLLQGLSLSQHKFKERSSSFVFPLTAFTALFGGPGLHGYGKHQLNAIESLVEIDGMDGLRELLPQTKAIPMGGTDPQIIRVCYDRINNMARVELEYSKNRGMISSMWKNLREEASSDRNQQTAVSDNSYIPNEEASWACMACTMEHVGTVKQLYLACELCGTSRSLMKKRASLKRAKKVSPCTLSKQSICAEIRTSSAWGSLRPPSDRDVHGPRKRHKGLDAPPPLLDYILVMDFEWTADDKFRMEPISEITQLPAVVMKLEDRKWGAKCLTANSIEKDSPVPLPTDLSIPSFSNRIVNADAYAITAFDTFVRPTLNPTLTQFSIDLTAITQQDVNDAPAINVAVHNFMQWLESLDLVDSTGMRKGNWCFATWGDVDIMSTLRQELEFKSLNLPPCFDRWINLKHDSMFKKHYGREPRGGLRACVESIGAIWSGRAHNGLVDSLNTAKIVRHMVQTGFRFTRPTRGLDKSGLPFGAQKRQHR